MLRNARPLRASVALVKDFPTRKKKKPEHMAPARSVERNSSVGDEVDFGHAVVLNNELYSEGEAKF